MGFLDVVLSRALLRGFITAIVRIHQMSSWSCLPNLPSIMIGYYNLHRAGKYDRNEPRCRSADVNLNQQLIPMLGLAPYLHDTNIRPFEKFMFIVKHVKYANLWTAGLSLVSLTWLIGARILKQGLRSKVPALKFLPEIFLLAVCSIGKCNMIHSGRWRSRH
jgi:hypothetical protein